MMFFLQRVFAWARGSVRRCQGCGAPGVEGWLCAACQGRMPRPAGYCPRCGHMVAGDKSVLCGSCRLQPPPWSAVAFFGAYTGQLAAMLTRFKFEGDLGMGGVLGWMLTVAVQERSLLADVVVPVPMRPQALRSRGFNQSMELARGLARSMGWPVRRALHKVRDTRQQARLNRQQRRSNVAGAFRADASLSGLRVALVDDIMTTGSTLMACTEAILEAGAHEVWCAVVARA